MDWHDIVLCITTIDKLNNSYEPMNDDSILPVVGSPSGFGHPIFEEKKMIYG